MKKHEELKLLINSLDSEEKKKLVRSLNTEIKAVYQTIKKAKSTPQNLNYYKANQLKDIIIEQMRKSYNSDEQKILQGIVDARMFYYRELHQLGIEALEKAKKIAEEQEKYEYLSMIVTVEGTLINRNQHNTKKADMFNIGEKRIQYANALKNKSKISLIRSKIGKLTIESNVYFRKKESTSEIQRIKKEIQKLDPKTFISKFNLIDYFDTYRMLYLAKGNYPKSLEYGIKALEETKKNPNIIKAYPILFIRQISVVYVLSYYAKNMDIWAKTWEEIQNINTQSIKEKILLFQYISGSGIRLHHLMNTNSPNIRQELKQTIKKYEEYYDLLKRESKLTFPYFFLITYAFLKEYEKANYYLIKVLDNYEKKGNFRTDLYQLALLVQLSMFFEQGDFKALKSHSHNVKRQFQKRNELYEVEHIVLNFFHSFEHNVTLRKKKLKKLIKVLEDVREKSKIDGVYHDGQINWIRWAKRQL